MHLIIGTYTEQLPHVNGKADGILTASFDPLSAEHRAGHAGCRGAQPVLPRHLRLG